MSVGFVVGLVVLLGGYALLYKMVAVWQHRNVAWRDLLFVGCDQ